MNQKLRISGENYRHLCDQAPFSRPILAQLLGLEEADLEKRFQEGVPMEAGFAIRGLIARVMSARWDKLESDYRKKLPREDVETST